MSIAGAARALVAVVAAASLAAPTALAAKNVDSKVSAATQIIRDRQTSDLRVPASVVKDAKCVAALKVVKAGFGVGGQGSSGMLSCRTKDGQWSEPSFFTVAGANIGLQAGVQSADAVLVFMSDESRETLLHKPTFKLGGDASIAVGPVGEGAGASTTGTAAVLAYQDTKGLYAGLTLDGMVMTHQEERNAAAYGKDASPAEILTTDGSKAPASTKPFVDALNKYMPAGGKSVG